MTHRRGIPGLLSVVQAFGPGLTPTSLAKAERLLRRMRVKDGQDRLNPYLEAGEALLEGFVSDIAQTAGQCGPIARSAMHTSAMQKALGMFFMDVGARQASPEEGMRAFRLAADLMDRSRANALAALDLAVRIARSTPVTSGDPLASAMTTITATEPDDEPPT